MTISEDQGTFEFNSDVDLCIELFNSVGDLCIELSHTKVKGPYQDTLTQH